MKFSEVIGQEEVKDQLLKQLRTGNIPHAQLFHGPEGVGKLPMALAYASALLCTNPQNGEACGTCTACKMTNKLQHPDLHFVFPIHQSKKFSDNFISQWREQIEETPYVAMTDWQERLNVENQQVHIYVAESDRILRKISLTSQQGGYKVMIIWQADLMNVETANKLLKILEEPTPQTAFILISNHPDRLLPTILSRTRRMEFRPLTEGEISTALRQRNALQPDDAAIIAHQSAGSYVRALQQIHISEENETFFDFFVMLMRLGYGRKVRDLSQWTDRVAEWGRERQKRFLAYAQNLVRENFIYNLREQELNYMSKKESEFAKNFSRFVNERNVYGMMDELADAERDISSNGNAKIVFFDLALKIIMLIKK